MILLLSYKKYFRFEGDVEFFLDLTFDELDEFEDVGGRGRAGVDDKVGVFV